MVHVASMFFRFPPPGRGRAIDSRTYRPLRLLEEILLSADSVNDACALKECRPVAGEARTRCCGRLVWPERAHVCGDPRPVAPLEPSEGAIEPESCTGCGGNDRLVGGECFGCRNGIAG